MVEPRILSKGQLSAILHDPMSNQLKFFRSSSARLQRWRKHGAIIPLLGAMFVLAAGPLASADSINVAYATTQSSGSTWQYTYTLSGSLSSGDLLAIYFPVATSSAITNLSTTTSGFTTSVLQADSSLPADGEYDILANSTTSAFANAFNVRFTYSGTGTPGSQSFTLYDSSFATITSGTTTTSAVAAAPEPGSLALLGAGAAMLFAVLAKESEVERPISAPRWPL